MVGSECNGGEPDAEEPCGVRGDQGDGVGEE